MSLLETPRGANQLSYKAWYLKKLLSENLRSIWYMCLKTENCYLKIFVEIHVGEKVYGNA